MDDKSFFNQAGTPPSGNGDASAQSASQPEQNKVTEPVTMDLIEAKFQEFRREIQSSTDKAIGSVNKKVAEAQTKADDAIKMIELGGVTLTDMQKAEIKRNAINQAYTDPQSPQGSNPAGQGQAPQESADPITNFVNKTIFDYMTEKGVTLDPSEMQPFSNLRPDKFIAKAEELIDQKARTRSLSAIPNQAPGGAQPEGADALRKEYEEERRLIFEEKHPNIRRGDADMLSAMIANYRKRGMKGAP